MTIPLAEVLIIVITTLKWKNKNEGGMCFVLLINSHVNMVLLALIIYCFVTYCLYYKLVGIDLKSAPLWVKILTMGIDISTTSYSSELSNQNQTGLL